MPDSNLMLRFTATARNCLSLAQREAVLEKSTLIDVRHLLIGLAQLPADGSTVGHVLSGLGVTAEKLRTTGKVETGEIAQLDLSDGLKKALEQAAASARQRGDHKLSSAHLLTGCLVDSDAVAMLSQAGVTPEAITSALAALPTWTVEA